ncbi:MAG: hypothetical protein ABSG65_02870 [Bryobacteraceae bacterium]
MTEDEIGYIRTAIDRAMLSRSESGPPRPKVGAVLVKTGKEMGTAFRGELELGDHAEFGLLERKLKHDDVSGGILYTTLEPCTVRSPSKIPCAERIVSRRLRRVVIGMLDPNQLICGKGVRYLRMHGLEVDLFPPDFMATVEDQNRDFILDQERQAALVVDAGKTELMFAVNPNFEDDLTRLDKRFKLESITDHNTVFIVAGETIVAELLDRHTCGLLRSEIDRRNEGHPFKRGIVVSAQTWRNSNTSQKSAQGSASVAGRRTRSAANGWRPQGKKVSQHFR